MKVDDKAFQQALDKLIKRVPAALEKAARRTAAESRVVARKSSILNIYATEPGDYQRTRALLNGWEAQHIVSGAKAAITISNSVKYAGKVEKGKANFGLVMRVALANNGKPVSLGRSGKKWRQPAPMASVASVYASRRMRELFILNFSKPI